MAATTLTNTAHTVLRLYERDLGSPGRRGPHHALALALFYQVADSVTEDWLACPALRQNHISHIWAKMGVSKHGFC